MKFDFHMHSTYSDGSSTIEEIFKEISKNKGKAIAITDHDTILGLNESDKLSKKYKVPFIPAAEFTVIEDNTKLHVLGYNLDINSKELIRYSEDILQFLNNKSKKQIKKLQSNGYKIEESEFFKQSQGGPLYRAKLLRTLSEYGYIKKEDIMYSMKKFFDKDDGICYVADEYPYYNFEKVCNLIKRNNGKVVLAHPAKIKKKNEKLYEELINSELLDGIEVYHPSNNEEVRKELLKIVEKKDLILTGGTDYHGLYRKKYLPLMSLNIPEDVYYNLCSYLRNNCH